MLLPNTTDVEILCTLLHFNSHFSRWTWVSRCKGWWRWWWQLYVSYKLCKAPVKSSPPTSSFLQAGCPSCRPTNSVKAMKGKYHIPWTCLAQAHLGVFQLCLWTLIAPGYLGGGLPCPLMPVPHGILCTNKDNWRALWKNRICSTTIKLRKSRIKLVTRQKTCNYIQMFGSSAEIIVHNDTFNVILWTCADALCMTISGGRTEQLDIIAGFLPRHWLYKWFSSTENVCRHMRRAWWSRVKEHKNTL